MSKKFKKIVIFPGSFDPFHFGHLKIAEYAIDEIGADHLFIVPSLQSVFKENKPELAKHRVEIIKLSLKNSRNISISNFEIKGSNPTYTFKTIEYFKKKFRDASLFLIIGQDNLERLSEWKNISLIKNLCQIVVMKRRDNFSKDELKSIKINQVQIIDNPVTDASSSEILLNFKNKQISPSATKYINLNLLYLQKRIKNRMSEERWAHSQRVSKLAEKIARLHYPALAFKAKVAGLFHDVAKDLSPDETRKYLKEFQIIEKNSYLHHALIGAAIVKNHYQISNAAIIDAIKHHTEPPSNPPLLSKILYVADKLESGKKLSEDKKLTKLLKIDLELCYEKINSTIRNKYKN